MYKKIRNFLAKENYFNIKYFNFFNSIKKYLIHLNFGYITKIYSIVFKI